MNPRAQVRRFASPGELAETVARDWLNRLSAIPLAAGPKHIALPGGRSGERFLAAAAALAGVIPVDFGQVHFFWGDERCVLPHHPDSNFGMAERLLFHPLDIGPAQVHRIRVETDPETAAQLAEAELRQWARIRPDGQPALDLVILGMGEDGHVASLFPGEPPEARNSTAVFRPVVGPKPPSRRVTLGYGPITAAREVWVLASGAGKQDALRQSLAVDSETPLGRVIGLRQHTRIYTDLAA